MRLTKSLETNRRRASRFDTTGFMTTMRQESLTPFATAVGLSMKTKQIFFFVCLATQCGCRYIGVETPLVPFKSEITAGHRYTDEAIAFLDAPGTTREEVIANLGPPLLESHESQVLVYAWQVTSSVVPFQIVSIEHNPATGAETRIPWNSKREGTVQQWGLFIAYNYSGQIVAHEIKKTGTSGLEEACVAWRRAVTR